MNTKLIYTLFFVIAIFCVTPTKSQTSISPKLEKKFEKLYDKAIKKGKDSYGVYHAKSPKDEEEEAFCNYLEQRGFFVIESFIDFNFIEDKFIEDYVCRKHTSNSYENFTKNCYYHYSEWGMMNEGFGSSFARTRGLFRRHEISWLGDVVDGNIEGKGIGLIRDGNTFYILTDGEFHHGFPTSNVNVTQIRYEKYEKTSTIKLVKADNKYIFERGLYGSDALTQKAAIAYYKDYYAGMSEEERSKLDEKAYYDIHGTIEVDFYIGAFPNGRHIQEVTQWVPNNYAGFRIYQLKSIDKALNLIQSYIKERLNGGSNLLEMNTTKPSSEEASKIIDENERLLKRCSYFAKDIQENLPNDDKAQYEVQKFYDYIDILNSFYAVDNSSNIGSCVKEDFWGQATSPNPKTTYTLNRKGQQVKSLFETAGKTILKRIDEEHFAEYDLLLEVYDHIYQRYDSFIKSVNGKLAMDNKKHVSDKLSNCTLKEYKFEDDELVIILQNNDIYRFHQSEGKWKYSSGKTAKVFPSVNGYNSIEEAIAEAEKMNRDFWNLGK